MSNKRTCSHGTHFPSEAWTNIINMVPSVANHTAAHERKVAEFQANNPTFAPVLDVFERMEITQHDGEYLDWFEVPNYMGDIHHWDLALTEYNLGPEGSAEALGAVCSRRRSLGGMLLFVYESPRRFSPEDLPLIL